MKPLIVSSLYHPNKVGGAEKVARIVAEGMLQHGHEPVVVTTQEGSGTRVSDVNGVKVYYIGLKNLYWPYDRKDRPAIARAAWHGIDRFNPLMARAVARVLDIEKPEVVNTHNLTGFSCAVWAAVKSRRLPLIHTLHDYSLICPKTSMFKDGRNCQGQCTACAFYTSPSKRLSEHVDHVVGVSRFTLERHLTAGYFQHAEARVIHNALPGRPASGAPPDRTGRPLRLGYVGQLTPTKGIGELVRQMSAWDSSQCQLVVAGRGAAAYEALLRRDAPENVRFLGFVNPDEVYRAIDVLVVPSLWQEPLAMTVLEAYMHGIPVIVSSRGGLPEAIEEKRTGLVYEPLEPGGLRRAVDVFLGAPQLLHDMRLLVLEKANYFQLERMLAEYLDLMANAKESSHRQRNFGPDRVAAPL
jgi:glycosyltransferase involved in cell wall biosynthesis